MSGDSLYKAVYCKPFCMRLRDDIRSRATYYTASGSCVRSFRTTKKGANMLFIVVTNTCVVLSKFIYFQNEGEA